MYCSVIYCSVKSYFNVIPDLFISAHRFLQEFYTYKTKTRFLTPAKPEEEVTERNKLVVLGTPTYNSCLRCCYLVEDFSEERRWTEPAVYRLYWYGYERGHKDFSTVWPISLSVHRFSNAMPPTFPSPHPVARQWARDRTTSDLYSFPGSIIHAFLALSVQFVFATPQCALPSVKNALWPPFLHRPFITAQEDHPERPDKEEEIALWNQLGNGVPRVIAPQ